MIALFVLGLVPRLGRARALKNELAAAGPSPVIVVIAAAAGSADPLLLPGTVQALHQTPIYARTNGYVRRWTADIGTRVRAGQVLAELETPDLDHELDQAKANLAQSRAGQALARTTFARWRTLQADSAVSPQELDERKGAADGADAAVTAAEANVRRLESLQGFGRVVAPFTGTITARRVDVGQLVTGGSNPDASLFTISETDTMRIYVDVPQSYVSMITPGDSAHVFVQDLSATPFPGRIARSAGALDPGSRTMRVEVQVPNKDGRLLPGLYAQVSLGVKRAVVSVRLPASTVVAPASGPEVVIVGADSIVHRRKVQLGRDYGATIDVQAGVNPGDRLVVNPTDDLTEGLKVAPTIKKDERP
jgi:RND family efflux transporter MFP subunit